MIRTIQAPPPFDKPDADVILRSSDMEPVDFRAFKLLLSLSSPFFTELFTLPQPSTPYTYSEECLDGRRTPVIQMTEDAETLRILLGFCFPISTHELPKLTSLQGIQKVAEAAVKFEMDGIVKYLRCELLAPRFVESQPLRAFAIAYRHGWDAEARKAARYTLRHPVEVPFVPELEYISGATLYRLQEYHRLCGEVASSRALLQPALAEPDDHWTWVTCRKCPAAWNPRSNNFVDARQWWIQWTEDISEALRQRPWGEIVRKWDIVEKALARAATCSNCGKQGREDMEEFARMLAAEIERDVSLVSTLLLNEAIVHSVFRLNWTWNLVIGVSATRQLTDDFRFIYPGDQTTQRYVLRVQIVLVNFDVF